jgi:hypothetical protein
VNWRRGLFRLWLGGSGAWLIFWTVYYVRVCGPMNTGELVCEDRARASGGFTPLYTPDPVHIAAIVIGLPLMVLATGLVLAWIARGFRGK